MKKINFKKFIGKIHLWLGLTSGLIVFIIAITGCIYVFSDEFTNSFRKNDMYVQSQEKPLDLNKLWESTQQQLGPTFQLSWVNVYNNPTKSYIFYAYKSNENAITYFENIEYYKSIYVDPYTGKILNIYNEELDFFNIVKMLHWSLLLKTEYGQPIVGYSTIIFVLMLISGFILWWPKNKKSRKQRLAFQWKNTTKWKRKNYDFHNILGFYVGSVAIIIALTGLVWAFSWFQAIVYVVGSGTTTPPDFSRATSTYTVSPKETALKLALETSKTKYLTANGFRITPAKDSTDIINVYIQQYDGLYYVNHSLQFDQYSGKLLKERNHKNKNFGEKIINANYDIHV
uniref:PepSY-associated TM helix domain-containing protein n=1 Tax=Lutibacter sp. TaxID=1925666 RepID=UPI0035669D92